MAGRHDHRTTANICLAKSSRYGSRELEFLRSIEGAAEISEAQQRWLSQLADPVDFEQVNTAAREVLQSLLKRWLPTGQLQGHEWVALNPTRADTSLGSFRINVTTGKWADFAFPNARGGDPVSLAAYLHHGGDQVTAARALKRMLTL